MLTCGAILFFAVASPAAALKDQVDSNPLGQVLDLLSDLSAKVKSEGEAEAKDFEAYAEWCDDVFKNKKFEIETASARQEKLEASIAELSADIEASDTKISELAQSIATDTADVKAATEIRSKEASDFATSDKELAETVDTLGRAVTILEREMQQNPASFAQVASKGMASILDAYGVAVDAMAFSASDKQRLLGLIQAKSDQEDGAEETGAPAAAAYKSHSSSIFDVLEDLKEKAEGQLSALRKAEATSKHNYAMLKQSLDDQIAADNKALDATKADKASSEEGKATAEGDLSVTLADLQNAKDALQTAKTNCAQVASDHDASVKATAEELKVIAEAKGILEETTSGAVGQTYSLLQLRSGIRTKADLARTEVVAFVKALARKHHSAALAQLASRIAAVQRFSAKSRAGPFDKVKGLIESMIAKLQKEGDAEANEKAYCDEEMSKSNAKNDELSAEISKLTTKIDQAKSRSTELKEDVKELDAELASIASEQAEMDKLRQQRHADYVQAKADLELGLSGVRKALTVLNKYYAKSEVALLQDGSDAAQPSVPVYHKAATGAGDSIIGILEVVESDFAKDLAAEESEEASLLTAYEKNTQENKVSTAKKNQDVTYKTQEYTGLDKAISELSSDRKTASTEQSAVLEYLDKLKDRCIAKPETYETRKARREAEIAGLKEALSILEAEGSFVQRGAHRLGHQQRMRGSTLSARAAS